MLKLGLRTRILLFFVAIALGAVAALAAGLWFGYHRGGSPQMFGALMQGAIAAGFLILALVTWIWFLFDTHIARPIDKMASAMRARAHADVEEVLEAEDVRYLGDLAAAASETTATLATARAGLTEAVQRETARLSSDKGKLEQLLADVPPAVLLCTGRHHLVFYNGIARQLLSGGQRPVCLDRNVFDYLSEGPIRDAHHRLLEAGDPDGVAEFLCLSPCGLRRLAGRMRLAGDNEGDAGAYVMTLRDVTQEVAAYARRDVLLSDIFMQIRPAVTELHRSMVPGPSSQGPLNALERMLDALEARFEACRSDGWPMASTEVRELAEQLRREMAGAGLTLHAEVAAMTVRCNAFDIVSLLTHIAIQVRQATAALHFALSVSGEGERVSIGLVWDGPAPDRDELDAWLKQPVFEGAVTCDTILKAHGSQMRLGHEAGRNLIATELKSVERPTGAGGDLSRDVTYDFELLSRLHYEKLSDAKLDALTYVVFDTETTGLLPEQGDEIVQIAAVRIVNGKRIKTEVFDLLVNPGRPIPASSTAVHGVTDDMVRDAVDVAEAVRQFHRFAEGAVLVAHNAPFDMEFLSRRERELGLRFHHAIVDTVLVSASVFGQTEVHTLDALAKRLGVVIDEKVRHTALGDAIATADVFIKMKEILIGQGCHRFGDLLTQTRRHGRLLRDLNDDARIA